MRNRQKTRIWMPRSSSSSNGEESRPCSSRCLSKCRIFDAVNVAGQSHVAIPEKPQIIRADEALLRRALARNHRKPSEHQRPRGRRCSRCRIRGHRRSYQSFTAAKTRLVDLRSPKLQMSMDLDAQIGVAPGRFPAYCAPLSEHNRPNRYGCPTVGSRSRSS